MIEEHLLPRTWRHIITLTTVLFCWCLIGLLVWRGASDNSLHSSALAWSFSVQLVVLVGLGFQAAVPLLAAKKG